MPDVKFVLAIDGVPSDVRPGDARVGAALAAAPVPVDGDLKRLDQAVGGAVQKDAKLTASPYDTDAYASGFGTGKAAFSVVSSDASAVPGKERYGAFFAYNGPGTGDPAVIGSTFATGVANLKKDWFNTTVPGQTIGLHITTRGGYHGPLKTTAPAEFGGYYPGGDTAGIIINAVQSSPYASLQASEYSIHYAENGRFDASGDVHSMNVQIAAAKIKNPDGSPGNPGIGLALTASAGNLGYAIQVVNTARPGSFNNDTPGHWAGFARYNRDNGTKAYDAWRVDQDGSVYMAGSGTTTPSKKIRIGSVGEFQITNHAGSVIFSLTNAGVPTFGPNNGAWTAYSGSLQFDNGSTAVGTFNGRYEVSGKRLTITALYSISSVGATPGGAIYVPLPTGMVVGVAAPGSGNEYAVSGKMLNVRALGGASRLTLINYDNTTPVVAGAQGMLTVVCELQ